MQDQPKNPQFPPQPPKGEQGMILIMVLLLMTMLAMLGSAAALRTAMDLREGGAERIARASYRVSEAGTVSVLSLASQMQAGFSDFVNGKTNKTLSIIDVGDTVIDMTAKSGSFGLELAAVGGATFDTAITDSDAAASVPGYDAGRFCFRTYNMVTTARLGPTSPTSLQQSLSTGQTRLQSAMTVGPVPCGQ